MGRFVGEARPLRWDQHRGGPGVNAPRGLRGCGEAGSRDYAGASGREGRVTFSITCASIPRLPSAAPGAWAPRAWLCPQVSTCGENSVHLERKKGREPNGENAGDRVEEEARHLVAHEATCTASGAAATRAISDPGPTSSVLPRLAHTGSLWYQYSLNNESEGFF